MRAYIEGIGLCGPGLDGWTASLSILSGRLAYSAAPTRIPSSTLLPANERRRAVQTVKLALAVGTEAIAAASRNPAEVATVFTSSGGDGETIHEILTVLASSERELSPIRFHNSVHNAPAGYWGIATGAETPSCSLCCHDDSFVAGLLEAAVQATMDQHAVALIAYDVQYPAPLGLARPIAAPFAVALVLAPQQTQATVASLEMVLRPMTGTPTVVAAPALEALRQGTPAARSLPLLEALARHSKAELTLGYFSEMELALKVSPLPSAASRHAAPSEITG